MKSVMTRLSVEAVDAFDARRAGAQFDARARRLPIEMEFRGVPLAPEANPPAPDATAFAHPPMPPLPLGGPPPEVLVSPEHMTAYAANCKRTLHYAVNGTLLAKRDHILHQMGKLRARMLEVAHTKEVAEREVQHEASEALARLNASESLKQMRIQREVDELARHADAINVLAAEIDAVTSDETAHTAEFLGRYRVRATPSSSSPENARWPDSGSPPVEVLVDSPDPSRTDATPFPPRTRESSLSPSLAVPSFVHQAMYDACDRLARRPLPEPAAVDAADFEREARAYTAATRERDALTRLLSVKDNMIWTLVEERRQLMEEVATLKAQKQELAGVKGDGDDEEDETERGAAATDATGTEATGTDAGSDAGSDDGSGPGSGSGGGSDAGSDAGSGSN